MTTCRNDLEETHKAKDEEILSKILMRFGKGEVNWTEVNELERAIENLEDNIDDCCKALQTPRVLGKWPKKVKR